MKLKEIYIKEKLKVDRADEDTTSFQIEIDGDVKGEIITTEVIDGTYHIEFDDIPEEERDKIFTAERLLKLDGLETYDQGKGYAKELMNHVIKWAKRKKYKQLFLNASPMGSGLSLGPLTNFYKKFGFEVIKKQGPNNQMLMNLK